jgi:hypothetical protein
MARDGLIGEDAACGGCGNSVRVECDADHVRLIEQPTCANLFTAMVQSSQRREGALCELIPPRQEEDNPPLTPEALPIVREMEGES